MKDPLQLVLQQTGLQASHFAANSRYFGLETATLEREGQDPVNYLRRRFIAPTDQFDLLSEHTVTAGERPDLLAYRYLGDAEQFWRICDANGVLHPHELTAIPGSKVKITLPEGIPGSQANSF